ncbi:MAG: hypothetical protein EON89_14200 [Brevundimonas sp.]|nr:MAG: hypothetical protein EON89_14200 [Brevundimonas sp.]
MRPAAALIGVVAAASLFALATPLDDHRASVPVAEDIGNLETLLDERLLAGLWAPALPPGPPLPGYPVLRPDRARPLDKYVRHYTLVTLRSEEDLPFTTIDNPLPAGLAGRRIVGVLASPDIVGQPAGIVISQTGQLPKIFHGGCSVVNVIYDPQAGRLVSAWCNVPNL